MRILTTIAGVLLTVIGALCFLWMSSYNFSALAFPIGVAMLIAGICICAAYLVSGRARRVTDTVLVEGIVMALFGFVVINDQVKDAMLPIFFGSLLVISGASRIAQSFDISRYRPKDWAKVIVFAIPTTVLGLIMMMPSAISTDTPLMLVGASFIINGFSMLIYTMFSESRSSEEKANEVKARAAAKQQAAEEKRRQRDELRKLSREEQLRIKAETRRKKKEEEEQKREEKRLEREAERRSRQPATRETIAFSKEESEEIKEAAKELGFDNEAPENKVPENETPAVIAEEPQNETSAPEADNGVEEAAKAEKPAAEEAQPKEIEKEGTPEESEPEESKSEETKEESQPAEAKSEEQAEPEAVRKEKPEESKWPYLKRPVIFPSLRSRSKEEAPAAEAETQEPAEIKLSAIKLDEIEEENPEIEFGKTELPDVELSAKGGEAQTRQDILAELDQEIVLPESFTDYEALKLEDLISEELPKANLNDPADKSFTQRLTINWMPEPEFDSSIEAAPGKAEETEEGKENEEG
ncbi:MAG: DUF308 domain-containing protein [Firmicutes bacterium]|nr:DUF308 domain-containing protein [Bacillota bacterium]